MHTSLFIKFLKKEIFESRKVIFKQPIFEDDFPDRGMKAWLVDIIEDTKTGCYVLYFDFTDFEIENEKYMKANYYDKDGRACLTARQAGFYNPKYEVYFGDLNISKEENEELFNQYLMFI